MKINYKFQPVNFTEITNSTKYKANDNAGEAPDLSFMEAAV